MLYSQKQFRRDQLLKDLTALRCRLEKGWQSSGWGHGEVRCILGHVNGVIGRQLSDRTAKPEDDLGKRFGSMIWAIHTTLFGGKAPASTTISQATGQIMRFNDQHANVGAVVLLLDRAIQFVQEQSTVMVAAE